MKARLNLWAEQPYNRATATPSSHDRWAPCPRLDAGVRMEREKLPNQSSESDSLIGSSQLYTLLFVAAQAILHAGCELQLLIFQ